MTHSENTNIILNEPNFIEHFSILESKNKKRKLIPHDFQRNCTGFIILINLLLTNIIKYSLI